MSAPTTIAEQSKVTGLCISDEYRSAHQHGVMCIGEDHCLYGADRVLREGNRVRVAAVSDTYHGEWKIAELRCEHCSLEIDDSTALIPDFSVYGANHVIVATATIVPEQDRVNEPADGFVLDDPTIIHSRRNVQST